MITELTHKYLNGETTAAEERQLLQLLKDEPRPTAEQKALCDVNGDGNVDTLDAAMIQKFAAGKITEFKKK